MDIDAVTTLLTTGRGFNSLVGVAIEAHLTNFGRFMVACRGPLCSRAPRPPRPLLRGITTSNVAEISSRPLCPFHRPQIAPQSSGVRHRGINLTDCRSTLFANTAPEVPPSNEPNDPGSYSRRRSLSHRRASTDGDPDRPRTVSRPFFRRGKRCELADAAPVGYPMYPMASDPALVSGPPGGGTGFSGDLLALHAG